MDLILKKINDRDLDDVKSFLKTIGLVVALGFLFEYVTGMGQGALKGVGYFIIFAFVFIWAKVRVSYDQKEIARYDAMGLESEVEEAEERERLANERANAWNVKYNLLAKKANALYSDAKAVHEKSKIARSEVERLRKDQQTYIEKLQTLEAEKQKLNKQLANATAIIEEAEANAQTRIANAVAKASKASAPFREIAKSVALYKLYKQLSNINGPYKDDEEKRREASTKASTLNSVLTAFAFEGEGKSFIEEVQNG